MSKSLAELTKQRSYLIAQCAQQRVTVAECIAPLRKPLAIADIAIASFQYLRAHPLVLVGSGLLYASYRIRSVGSWSRKAWVMLSLFSKARGFIKHESKKSNGN